MAGLLMPDPTRVQATPEPDIYASIPGIPQSGGPSISDMVMAAERLSKPALNFDAPAMPSRGADIWASPSGQKFRVNDMEFGADDEAAALESEALLSQPGTGAPPPGDWVALDQDAYGQYLNQIKNPTLKRLAKRNFGRGVDISQMLAGRGLQLAGAEQTGGNIVANQMEDLRKTQPYERMFTDIDSGRGAVEWLVANFAQQGPNLIESVATMLVGSTLGMAAGGPAAALAGMVGKESWKASVKAALRKKAAGEVLQPAEAKLLKEAAALTGAVAASYAQNVATGASDIYGELRDSGVDANDVDARLKAIAGSAPYALLETIPEYLVATRALFPGNVTRPLKGRGLVGGAGELARRAGVGFAVGGVGEGLTEAGQEGLLIAANDKADIDSPEGVNRLINSFAAGFGVGGPIGGVVNLRGKSPANLLEPGKTTEPQPTTTPPAATPPAAAPEAGLVGPQPLMDDMFGGPVRMPNAQMPILPGDFSPLQQGIPPATEVAPGQQSMDFAQPGEQLGLFGGTATQVPTQMPILPGDTSPLPSPYSQTVQNPAQGALQFAPPAPEGPRFTPPTPQTTIADLILAAERGATADRAYGARAQEQAGQEQQVRDRAFAQAEGQRQLDLAAEPAPIDQTLANMPMRETGPRQPQQMSLFKRGQLPKPSGVQRLQKGMAPRINEFPGEATAPANLREQMAWESQQGGQLQMFSPTAEGGVKGWTPTVAALKGAGLRRKVKTMPAGTGVPQAPPTGSPANAVSIAKARAAQKAKSAPDRGLKKQAGIKSQGKINAVQERSAAAVDARQQAGNGEGMGGQVPPPVKAARAGGVLQKGKPKATGEPDKKEPIVSPVKAVKEPPIAQFRRDAAVIEAGLPPVAAGMTRLWRGNRPGEVGKNPQFTDDLPGIALPFQKAYGGDLSYVDVPTARLKEFVNEGVAAANAEFILPADLAAKARVAKKEEPPGPKSEAAATASVAAAAPSQTAPAPAKSEVSAKADGPIPIRVQQADGSVIVNKDGKKLLEQIDKTIDKFERFLACLRGK